MALAKDKHPQKDFFFLDISDVVPRDDLASMEHPLFSLTTKPDLRDLEYSNGENSLKITPSHYGLPNIFDKDILIYCVSQLMERKNRGLEIGNKVRFSAHEMMVATNRQTGGVEYARLKKAFHRLRGTSFETNIKTGQTKETRIFGLIDEGGFVSKQDSDRLDYCEVVLSDWLMRAIKNNEVATISRDYFRLRRPLERRIYELSRKHCGNSSKWQIRLEKLQLKTGSTARLARFRSNLREIIAEDVTPFYRLELTPDDLVIVRPRKKHKTITETVRLPEWAEEKGREIAVKKGWDYYSLEREWREHALRRESQGDVVKNPGAAFVAFCQKAKNFQRMP